MNEYEEWYDLADWLNTLTDNKFTPKDVAQCAYELFVGYNYSRLVHRATSDIHDLIILLLENNSPEAFAWFSMIYEGIHG